MHIRFILCAFIEILYKSNNQNNQKAKKKVQKGGKLLSCVVKIKQTRISNEILYTQNWARQLHEWAHLPLSLFLSLSLFTSLFLSGEVSFQFI